jgi:beta-glucosidase
MLANRLGARILKGCADYGIINGPKHLGANDQEYKRAGLNEFMTEQKLREGDLRCFQAALEPKDGNGLAVMIAFNRIGSTNACHSVGVIKNILRGEWGFNGIISTDMATNPYYFIAEAMVMSTITQVADFAQNDNHINANDGVDKTWGYISVNSVKNDKEFVEQARQDLKYQLLTFANSYIFNVKTTKVTPAWETAINTVKVISIVLTSICAIGAVALLFVPGKKKEVA